MLKEEVTMQESDMLYQNHMCLCAGVQSPQSWYILETFTLEIE